jgi:hypothetical protein
MNPVKYRRKNTITASKKRTERTATGCLTTKRTGIMTRSTSAGKYSNLATLA